MKKIKFSILIVLLTFLKLQAQITANLVLNPRPPSYLSQWDARAGQLVITVAGAAQSTLEVVLETKIINEAGQIIAVSNLNMAKPILINARSQIIRMDQVLQLENLKFSSSADRNQDPSASLARSGKLPPGVYTLSLRIFQAKTGRLLVEKLERRFNQVNYILPFLLFPQNQTWVDANSAQSVILFRWSGLVPVAQERVTYRLSVFEIQDQQTPMQALRSNMPILNTDINNITQYIWRPQLDMKVDSAKTFIWTIQSLDFNGQIISTIDITTQGRSEPRVFGICSSKNLNKGKCGEGYDWTSFKNLNKD